VRAPFGLKKEEEEEKKKKNAVVSVFNMCL
jgi:hypothetical protein